MIAIKIKLNQTSLKCTKPSKCICLSHLLAVINDAWYSNSFLALEVLGMDNSGDSPDAWIDMALCTSCNRTTSSFHNTHAAPASLVLLEPRLRRREEGVSCQDVKNLLLSLCIIHLKSLGYFIFITKPLFFLLIKSWHILTEIFKCLKPGVVPFVKLSLIASPS